MNNEIKPAEPIEVAVKPRSEWRRPELRKLDARNSEGTVRGVTDYGTLS